MVRSFRSYLLEMKMADEGAIIKVPSMNRHGGRYINIYKNPGHNTLMSVLTNVGEMRGACLEGNIFLAWDATKIAHRDVREMSDEEIVSSWYMMAIKPTRIDEWFSQMIEVKPNYWVGAYNGGYGKLTVNAATRRALGITPEQEKTPVWNSG